MAIIAKVPTSAGSLKRSQGCEKAPSEIVEHLKTIYSNEFGRKPHYEIMEVKTNDSNPDETHKNILKTNADIFLGGDHSITYSSFQTMKSGSKALIILDAHPDLDTGTNTPTHEDYLRRLIEENHVNPEYVFLIGIRNYGENELEFIKQNRIKAFTSKQVFESGIEDTADTVTEASNECQNVYLSIDIDAVDPSAAPGTGCPEPAGLSSRDALYLIERIKRLKNLAKADIVEVNPDKDVNHITSRLAARMLMELI